MISPAINRISNIKYQISKSPQAGVTLLLAILILASVLAISFSLTTILFIEIRSSSDLLKTESSLFAATGVAEQALFNLNRQACLDSQGNATSSPTCYTSDFSNSVSLNPSPTVQPNYSPILYDKVTPNTTFSNSSNKYDFCNGSAGNLGCNYGKMILHYSPANTYGETLYAYMCEFDPSEPVVANTSDSLYGSSYTYASLPCSTFGTQGSGDHYWLRGASGNSTQLTDGSVNLSASVNSVTWTLDPNKQQQLILTNPTGTHNIYFSVETYADQEGTTSKGLPYVGKTAVDVNTSSGAVGRKIQVVVPNSH